MFRILLVEDEPLIASLLCDWLETLGHAVVGPAATSTQATGLLHGTSVDAAIVDIWVRDGDTYTLAAELKRRLVPFVFATGHSADAIDSRFSDIPSLSKPFGYECFKSAVLQMTSRRVRLSHDGHAPLIAARSVGSCGQAG